MPRIEHIIAAILIIWALVVIMRRASRTEADQAQPSWAVRTLNAAGADVEAKRLLPATAELAQRGIVGLAGKARETVSAKVSEGKAKRAEAKAAREERLAELGEKAIRRGLDFVDAARWRWQRWRRRSDGPFVDRRTRTPDDQPEAGGEDAPDRAERRQRRPRWRVLRRLAWRRRPRTRDRDRRADEDESPDQPEQLEQEPDEKPWRRRWQRFFRWRRRPAQQADASDEEQPEKARPSGRRDPDPEESGTPVTDPEVRTAWQRLAASVGGYCTAEKCTGYGTYIEIGPEGIRRKPCPHCTNNQEENMTATDERKPVITTPGTTADDGGRAMVPPPADWGLVAARVVDFNPDDDADLINFMTAEIAGMAAYSQGYEQLFETCTGSLGLDPRSVQALGEFGERFVEITAEMARARARFVAIYEEVMRMVADGTVMPHNGRFFTGNVPV